MSMDAYKDYIDGLIDALNREQMNPIKLHNAIQRTSDLDLNIDASQEMNFYNNVLKYLIKVATYLYRHYNKNKVNNTRKIHNLNRVKLTNIRKYMEEHFQKIDQLLFDYKDTKYQRNVNKSSEMDPIMDKLRTIHKNYLAMFDKSANSIKRSRPRSHGGTRKNRRTH
jgi:hypothetical protein